MKAHIILGAIGGGLIGQSIAGLVFDYGPIEIVVLIAGVAVFALGITAAVRL